MKTCPCLHLFFYPALHLHGSTATLLLTLLPCRQNSSSAECLPLDWPTLCTRRYHRVILNHSGVTGRSDCTPSLVWIINPGTADMKIDCGVTVCRYVAGWKDNNRWGEINERETETERERERGRKRGRTSREVTGVHILSLCVMNLLMLRFSYTFFCHSQCLKKHDFYGQQSILEASKLSFDATIERGWRHAIQSNKQPKVFSQKM